MAARVDDILSRIEASHPDGRGFFSLLETAWGSNAQLGIPAHNVRLEALHGMGGTGCWDFGNGSTRCPTIFPGGGSLGAPRACIISTRILGRRTAPLPPVLIPDRVPHGFHPKILVLCSSGASFNRTNWEAVGAAISDEIRAYASCRFRTRITTCYPDRVETGPGFVPG